MMSFFKNMFGGKKAEAAPTTSESIQKLRDTESMLIKKQDFLEQKLAEELKIAKENATSNKRGETDEKFIKIPNLSLMHHNWMTFVLFLRELVRCVRCCDEISEKFCEISQIINFPRTTLRHKTKFFVYIFFQSLSKR